MSALKKPSLQEQRKRAEELVQVVRRCRTRMAKYTPEEREHLGRRARAMMKQCPRNTLEREKMWLKYQG